MENNKRGQGGRKQSENKPEKRSYKTSRSSYQPAKQEKPYKKTKPAEPDRVKRTSYSSDKPEKPYRKDKSPESGRDQTERFRKDKVSEYGKEKPYASGKRPSRGRDDKPSSFSRSPKPEYSDSKPSGLREKRTSYSSDKPEKPYRRDKSPESGRDQTEGFRKGKDSEFSRGKPSAAGKRPTRRSDDKPSASGRGPKREYSDSRPTGSGEKRTPYSSDKPATRKARPVKADENAPLRLNKFIANAGICSRREADKLIESGAVKVNGVVVTELGTKVTPADKVQLGDQTLSSEKLRYVLLNKPKGFITTTDDPFKRNTVMKLVAEACRERIYPVGRLDRNTTGLLLFTNDGELAKRLTHPRFGIRKVYAVELDKPLSKKDMESIASGVVLEGETIIIDEIAYVEYEKDKKHIGIQLHSGQNRVVRRIFEQFGYEVVKLDRVMIGSLTKKDLPRGIFRHLTPAEVRILKRL